MRIGVWHDLPSGGGRRAMEGHLAALSREGHEILVLSPARAGDPLAVDVPQEQIPLAQPGRRTWAPLAPGPVVRFRLRALDTHLARAAARLSDWGADVVFVGSGRDVRVPDLRPHLAVPAALYLGEPYRWLYEALPEPAFAARKPGDVVRRLRDLVDVPAWRQMIRREVGAARAYERILVNSSYSRDSCRRALGVATTVCRLGVDLEMFRPAAMPVRAGLLSVGAMVPEKRALELVSALGASGREEPLTWVANVADETYLRAVRAAAEAHGVGLTVLIGISDGELARCYREAALFVYAPRLEPFGLAPVEAAASGLPVVAVAEGGVRESVSDGVTGLLVDELEDLPKAVAALLSRPEDLAYMGVRARAHAESHWDQAVAARRVTTQLEALVR